MAPLNFDHRDGTGHPGHSLKGVCPVCPAPLPVYGGTLRDKCPVCPVCPARGEGKL